MNFFKKIKNYEYNSDTRTIITNFNCFNDMISVLNYCYATKKQCVITDKSSEYTSNEENNSNSIVIIYKNTIHKLDWCMYFSINNFISKKYKIKSTFCLGYNVFNIFFIEFISDNLEYLSTDTKILVDYKDSFFGIYHTYQYNVYNCDYYLYFSFHVLSFILYKTVCIENYIVGKLFPTLKILDKKLHIGNKIYDCPKSFVKIKEDIFGIKRKKLKFNIKKSKISDCKNPYYLQKYHSLFDIVNHKQILILKVNNSMSVECFDKLYEYITIKYPALNNKKIFSLEYNETLSTIHLYINQHITYYTRHIIYSINYFLSKYSFTVDLNITPCAIYIKFRDKQIHLVSEIYYFIVCFICFLPKIFLHIKYSNNQEYMNANYKFSEDEVKKLFNDKNSVFTSNTIYIKSIFIKILSISMKNYYCMINHNELLSTIPILENMSNNTIKTYIERSNKACLNTYLMLYLFNMIFDKKNQNIEWPIIIFNLFMTKTSQLVSVEKIYNVSIYHNIPITINVYYNTNNLHVNISYKKKYSKFNSIFNETINELLK